MSDAIAAELLKIAQANADRLIKMNSKISKIEGALEHFPDGAEVHSIVDAKLSQHVIEQHAEKAKRSIPPPTNVIVSNPPSKAKFYQRIDWVALARWLIVIGASAAGWEGLKNLPF